jgi:hypothetical protein
VAAGRKSRLKARLSQNLMTFYTSVQRFVVGQFGEKAENLGERKLVVRWVLGDECQFAPPVGQFSVQINTAYAAVNAWVGCALRSDCF